MPQPWKFTIYISMYFLVELSQTEWKLYEKSFQDICFNKLSLLDNILCKPMRHSFCQFEMRFNIVEIIEIILPNYESSIWIYQNSHYWQFSISGERLIQFATENLVTEVLIHPQVRKRRYNLHRFWLQFRIRFYWLPC